MDWLMGDSIFFFFLAIKRLIPLTTTYLPTTGMGGRKVFCRLAFFFFALAFGFDYGSGGGWMDGWKGVV